MNLLKKYGALVLRSSAIALVHECYKKCCNRWICAYLDGGMPSERECYEEGKDDVVVISTHATEEECRQKCESWVCSWIDAENDAGRDCYPTGMQPYPSAQDVEYDSESECRQFCVPWVCAWSSPTDDPDEGKDCYPKGMEPGTVISEHDTEKECKEACYEGWVCAYRSSDPLKGRECYADTGALDPELIVLSEHDTEKECRDVCQTPWICAYLDGGLPSERACYEEGKEDVVILSEHGSKEECEKECVDSWVCAYYDSETPADRACYQGLDVGDPTIIVLSEHATESECKAVCVPETWYCAYRSIDPDKAKSCYDDDSDPELIVTGTYDTRKECEEQCKGDWSCAYRDSEGPGDRDCYEGVADDPEYIVLSDHNTEEECRKECKDKWVCAYSSSDPYKGRSCMEATDDPDVVVLSEHDSAEECEQQCYEKGYGCVIGSSGDYECLDVQFIDNPGDILSVHDTEEECLAACRPEVGACCVTRCISCEPGSCSSVSTRWEEREGECVEVDKQTSDAEEVWASDGCTVYSAPPGTSLETCGSAPWVAIGSSKAGCESAAEYDCYEGLTEDECREKAEYEGQNAKWHAGEKCDDISCQCPGYICEVVDTGASEPVYTCVEVDKGGYETKAECEKWCSKSVCSYYYTGEYDCAPYDPDVHDESNAVDGEYCERTCCEPCIACHDIPSPVPGYDPADDPSNIVSLVNCGSYYASKRVESPVVPGAGIALTTAAQGQWLDYPGVLTPGGSPIAINIGGFVAHWLNGIIFDPSEVDDCNGDGRDCNWIDEDAVKKLQEEGYTIRIWEDYTLKETDNQVGDYLTGAEGGYTSLQAHAYKWRAFTYDCVDGYKDRTDEILKRSEWRFRRMTLNGPNAEEIDPTYEEPLQPGIACPSEENPFP